MKPDFEKMASEVVGLPLFGPEVDICRHAYIEGLKAAKGIVLPHYNRHGAFIRVIEEINLAIEESSK